MDIWTIYVQYMYSTIKPKLGMYSMRFPYAPMHVWYGMRYVIVPYCEARQCQCQCQSMNDFFDFGFFDFDLFDFSDPCMELEIFIHTTTSPAQFPSPAQH